MLDGAARLGDMFARTAELGMDAIAMTDHGNVFGAFDFYSKATAAGVKPIIGMEAYLTPNTSRFDRKRVRWNNGGDDDVSGSGAYTHMTLLAETTEGMHNLFRLSSRSSIEGFFYKPRADRELLAEHARGLIGTTGCPSGEIQTWLRIGDYDKARAAAGDFQDIFGRDSFFLELMDHGLSIETRVREGLLRLSKDLGIPPVATNDSHYTTRRGRGRPRAPALRLLGQHDGRPRSASSSAATATTSSRPAEMRRALGRRQRAARGLRQHPADRRAVRRRVRRVGQLHAPLPGPRGRDRGLLVHQGGRARAAPTATPTASPAEVRKQADFEIGVITQMGFPGYFLVVADFINWAKNNGIRVGPGRGSGAGSMAAYAMRITDLDPLQHGLIFERFLNPDRVSMPDFDIDFDERRRGEVIRYVTDKYGDDRVSMIVTYGTIKAKQAVKDSSRILGYPFAMGDRITKAMPAAVMGKDVPLKQIFDPQHGRYGEGGEFRSLYDADADVKKVVDTAIGIEGLKRQWGVHAAGVIMSSAPLQDVIPVMKREQDGAIITQFDYPTCERLGLIKMDFLGLRNLTILDDALINITNNRGEKVVLEELALDDPATFALLVARRHARRLPARRRPDARAAAQHAPGHLRGHLRGRRALPPRPDGRRLPQQVRPPQERPRGGHADPPRAGRAARGHPGRDLRPDRLPGAGHGDRPEARGLLAGTGRPAAPGDGQEEEGRARQAVRGLLRGHAGARLLPGRGHDAVGHPAAVLRLRLQQGALRGLRPGVLLDRLPQGQLPRRVHGRRPHVRQGRQGQDGDLPQRVPPDEDPGAAARRQRVRGHLHPGRRRHPLRPLGRSATSASTSSTRSWRPAASRAASPTSPTSWTRCRRWSATSGSWSR